MKLQLLAAFAVALCLLSLAARSSALGAAAPAPAAKAERPLVASEQGALEAIDGHLRAKFVRLARR